MKKKIVAAALIAVLIVLFLLSSRLQNILVQSAGFLEQYISNHLIAGGIVFIGLAALSATLSFFSSLPLVPPAVLIWGSELTFVLLLGGWMLGGILTYFIGRYGLYPILRRFVHNERIEYYRQRIPENLGFLLVLLFRVASPAEIPGYVLGLLRYNFWKYLLATLIAELPFALIASYASDAIVSGQTGNFIGLVFTGLAVFGMAIYLLRKKLKF